MNNLSQSSRILKTIKAAGMRGVENYKLSQISLNYTMRVSELRREGYNIEATRQVINGRKTGVWNYHLSSETISPKKPKREGNEVIRELMIAKSKGRFACYKYVMERLQELGV